MTLVAWLIIVSRSSPEPAPTPIGPVVLSEQSLRKLAAGTAQPVFWAGSRAGYHYQLTKTDKGYIYVSYLGKHGRDAELTVATYPYLAGLKALQLVRGVQLLQLPEGAGGFVDPRDASHVHLAYPDMNYQIEIYGASPARVLQLARSGAVRQIR